MKKLLSILVAFFGTFSLLCGCGEVTETPQVSINQEKEQITYEFATVTRDTVTVSKKIKCTYTKTSEQEVTFNVTGKLVSKVYVNEGDSVKKGDVLVELSSGNLESEIETLEYRIARNKLLLEYTDENEYLDTQQRWVNYLYTSQSADDLKNAQEAVAAISKNYDKQRESLNDSLEFDELELKEKKAELKNSRIYAEMDGTVYKISEGLNGSTSKKDEVIMTIVDNSEGLFEVDDIEYKDCFTEDEIYALSISYGTVAGDYELKPLNMDEWTDKMYFSIYSGPDNTNLEVGTSGYLKMVTDSREDVLCLPVGTVYEADGNKFVYIVDEDNMREVKWIETGLEGDSYIEIVSGLSEGDKVVKK